LRDYTKNVGNGPLTLLSSFSGKIEAKDPNVFDDIAKSANLKEVKRKHRAGKDRTVSTRTYSGIALLSVVLMAECL